MLKILFLTYDIPYPLTSGGKIRAFHLLKGLSDFGHQVTLISYKRKGGDTSGLPVLNEYCASIYVFPRRWVWHPVNLLRALLGPLPLPAVSYHSSSLRKFLVKEIEGGAYDLVFFESFYPALYLPLAKKLGIPVIMGNENIEHSIYRRYTSQTKLFFLKPFYFLDNLKMKRFEEKLWRLADINLAVSQNDGGTISQVTGRECWVVPNGVDFYFYSKARLKRGGRSTLVFSGNLSYVANREAIRYFVERIFPKIKVNGQKVYLEIVSKAKPDWLSKYLDFGLITVIKDTKNPVRDYIARADVFIAPMTLGSGTNIKVLEAMATGVPVVTTPVGAEGLGAQSGKHLYVCQTPGQFAHQVSALLTDPAARKKIGKEGQRFVKERFDANKISKSLAERVERHFRGGD